MKEQALERIAEVRRTHGTELDLSNLALTELPDDLRNLTWLRSLKLGNGRSRSMSRRNRLTSLPEWLCDFTSLTWLELTSNGLTKLPEWLGNITSLTWLGLSDNGLTSLPDSLVNLTKLTTIDLDYNELSILPEWLVRLTKLTSLYLYNNNLSSFPEWLGEITGLTWLGLSDNDLNSIPESLGNLNNLTWLGLSNNHLTSIPESLGNLVRLKSLYLDRNSLSCLPESLGNLKYLTWLSFSFNGLTSLPDSIRNLTEIRSLILYRNKIDQIPEWLGDLKNMRFLGLSGNGLTSLPDSLANLTKLKSLYLNNNELSSLPAWLSNLTSLKELELSGNPLADIGPEVMAQGSEAVLAFVRGGRSRQWVSKLLLVGEGGVGKTSLLKQLSGKRFSRSEPRTHMLAVRPLSLPHPSHDEVTMTLNCWDFGGQDIYHATHQFYLTQRSLYLLVWNARTGYEQSKLYRWMETIKTRAGDTVPVLLIATHTKGNPARLPFDDLKRQYPQILDSLEVDSETGEGVAALKERIQQLAGDPTHLPLMGEKWPSRWLKAALKLRRSKEHCVTKAEFDARLEQDGITGDALATLTIWLHELGDILYFPDAEVLKDHVILNPQWVIARIANVLDSPDVLRRKGILTRAEMETVWKDLDAPIQDYLLHLMEQFDLSYRTLDDRNRSLVVECIPYDEPPYLNDWEAKRFQPEVRMRYKLTTLPAGVPTWFIARSFRYTLRDNFHWRLGGLFKDISGQHIALIQASPATNTIELAVRGPMPGYFFSLLRDTLEYTLSRFTRIISEKTLPCPCNQNCPGEFPFDALQDKDFSGTLQCHYSQEKVQVGKLLLGIADISVIERILREPEKELRDPATASDRVEYLHRQFLRRYRIQQRRLLERCPNVYSITPCKDIKLGPTEEAYRIHLYCQYPGAWHEIGEDCQFVIRQSKEAWEKAVPWLNRSRKIGAGATGIAAAILGLVNPVLAVPFGGTSALLGSMGDLESKERLLPEDLTAQARYSPEPDIATQEEYDLLVRLLRERRPDGDWCGLRIVEMQDGTYAWLCPHHYDLYVGQGRLTDTPNW